MNEPITVLLVEDDADVREAAAQSLRLAGFTVDAFDAAEKARQRIVPGSRCVCVSDVKLPGSTGLDFLRHVMAVDPQLPVILVTGHGDIAMAVQAMRQGAYDFIEKPFSAAHLVEVVERAIEKRQLTLEVQALRAKLDDWRGIEADILGRSPAIEQLRRMILDVADTSADVLIYGETGTGKELVARCLHEHSNRRQNKFVALNCGGLPETLFDSEIFGHETGSFTGAMRSRVGKIEYAHRGTLFLDEIESMPLSMQVKLLRVLQERRVERLGSNEPIAVDCRFVAASKEDLARLSAEGRFRKDLYYRLNVVVIELPPLRERREDIPLLFEHFVLQAASRYERPAPIVSSSQLGALMAYAWPGNVRELRNVADRFVLKLLGDKFPLLQPPGLTSATLAEQVERFERSLIQEHLRQHQGQVAAASEALGLAKNTLYDKLRKFHLSPEDYR
ncbi:sigma-54-dependent transcriptional regulator [Plasticicumulans lactativorans]|nr:sigma-54 dependent transcriptional regulator [Plasticicumulans lactativorans]